MSARLRSHLTYANVMATIAVFIALGGGAYAAFHLKKDSVKSKHIVNGQVKSKDLADGGVTGADVDESTLKDIGASGIANGAVTPDKLGRGPAASVLREAPETTHDITGTFLHADTELFDTAGLHADGSDSDLLTAPVSGTYIVSATVEWEPDAAGYRSTTLLAGDGGSISSVGGPALPPPAYTTQNVSGVDRLNAGEAVRVEALQGSGGDLDARLSRFELAFVAK
jgi:hypothetical protein